MKLCYVAVILFSSGAILPSAAAVIAATDFDGRMLLSADPPNNNTATSLNWTVNGVADPGNMAATTAAGIAQPLFNNTSLTQNMFAPALNTGNTNSFWNTTINLTVLADYVVTLESVSFDYWAIAGSGLQNVARRSDFTATLFDPFDDSVGEVSIVDVSNSNPSSASGVSTPVLLTFSSPLILSQTGTYTLRLRGGDYLGLDETGNHTAIDNLSINGVVSLIPEPSSLALVLVGGFGLLRRRR